AEYKTRHQCLRSQFAPGRLLGRHHNVLERLGWRSTLKARGAPDRRGTVYPDSLAYDSSSNPFSATVVSIPSVLSICFCALRQSGTALRKRAMPSSVISTARTRWSV